MKDLYSFTCGSATAQQNTLGWLLKNAQGLPEWYLHPAPDQQVVLKTGDKVMIEITVPNQGPPFVRYYRDDP